MKGLRTIILMVVFAGIHNVYACDVSAKEATGRYTDLHCEDLDNDGTAEMVGIRTARTGDMYRVVWTEAGVFLRRTRLTDDEIGSFTLADVCASTRALTSGEIWKSIASTHIPTTDPRRYSTSFITERGTTAPRYTCIRAYDGNGTQIHALGRYYPTGTSYSSRNYGGAGCGDRKRARNIAQTALANAGSTAIYLKVSAGVCAIVPNPNRCYNSSQC